MPDELSCDPHFRSHAGQGADFRTVEAPRANWPILAGTRFVLSLIVVSTHWTLVSDKTSPFFTLNEFGGLAAVMGFLVISGFSIAHSYETEPRRFFLRRLARIYPVYLVCIAAWWYIFQLAGQPILTTTTGAQIAAPTLWQTVQNAFMLQGMSTVAVFGPAWSLSIECWFYAATPLLMACRQNALRFLVMISAVLYFFIEPLSLTTLSTLQFGLAAILVGWAWLLGFILYRSRLRWLDRGLLLLAGTVLLAHYAGDYQPLSLVTYLAVCAALIIGPKLRPGTRTNAILNYLGELSYPLYLSHVPVLVICSGYFRDDRSFVSAIVGLLVAVTLVHLVDRPFRARLLRPVQTIDPVLVARWLIMAFASCGVAALAEFTGVMLFWPFGVAVTGCAAIGMAARRRELWVPSAAAGTAGYIALLGCAIFPQWTAYQLGGPLPAAVTLNDPASIRAVHGFQGEWVVGSQGNIYLSVPHQDSPLILRVFTSVPPYLAGQVVEITVGTCALGTILPHATIRETRLAVPGNCVGGLRTRIGLNMAKTASFPGSGTTDRRPLSLRVAAVSLQHGS